MKKKNSVFIATSIDGYIADNSGNIDWLHETPNPGNNDMGYTEFMNTIDALLMGRKTFETICGFDIDWPYQKPVFVLSNKLKSIPDKYLGKAFLIKGTLQEVLQEIHSKNYLRLYIDGGTTIRQFLHEELIDEMIITTIPILLGGGVPLFSSLHERIHFDLKETKTFLNQIVQTHYHRRSK